MIWKDYPISFPWRVDPLISKQFKFKAYPGCPTLAWFLKERISDNMVELDCILLFRGKKGTSKSTSSIGLSLGVAWELAQYYHKPWTNYFTVKDHVKTVDPDGTMDMFSKDIIKRKNSVLVADDVSISADARDAMTRQNKQLSKIITISRIFQNLITMNSVYSTHVDKRVRGFADIIIDMIGVHRASKQGIGKVYWYEVNQQSGKEYSKFFTWKGKRIKYFLFPLPPDYIIKEYKKMRYDMTDKFLTDIADSHGPQKQKVSKFEIRRQEMFTKYYDKILPLCEEGKSNRYIMRSCPGLTASILDQMRAQSGFVDIKKRDL
jgi:hypothetical protein